MRIIAFLTDPRPVRIILAHLGERTTPSRAAPARGPPLWEHMAQSHRDNTTPPAPEYVSDQRVSW